MCFSSPPPKPAPPATPSTRPGSVVLVFQDVTLDLPGLPEGPVSLDDAADVICLNNGDLILRNCYIEGALSFRLNGAGTELLIRGLAHTVLHYIAPGSSQYGG